ncbi:glycoside hydrolase superfamily [Kockovaella imperatae]|uniref:beta-galactosidase n=1 Tax=Kockovaella imperatae TaxID=4999 RepID=A0A1Y1UKM7_9TREE|nr:glycoside hydrolase superfamily [Kockovaella imperatae]ORX38601.1 glycoside hydrolase superfamily [Kockovaella imperatae]
MRLVISYIRALLIGAVACAAASSQVPFKTFTPSDELKSTNLTDLVQWDGYSLFVKGQRIFIYSGEFHAFRLIVPDLWLDVFQRIKALGFNAISTYTFWGMVNPSEGVFDYDDFRDLGPFLDAANQAGLFVVVRPGPYINAEVSAGGFPGWVTALPNFVARTDNGPYTEAYTPYWSGIGDVIAKYQITQGGPVIGVQIENEISNANLTYIENLEKLMRDAGIVVPFTFNDVSVGGYELVFPPGNVDIAGVDSYPQNSDCAYPELWAPVGTYYRPYLINSSGVEGEPFYIPEFQAGWIPTLSTGGYPNCFGLFGSAFERVFYLNNLAQGIKMQSIYMVYGGTNFGHTAFPPGLTSYDYWAPISEDRSFPDKYYELKLISHFIRSSRDLPKTWITASSNDTFTSAPGEIQVDALVNPDSHAGFWVVRHANSSTMAVTSFTLDTVDWQGNATLPVTLNGRDSRVVVTNYCWGASCISHSSSAILTSTTMGDVDYLIVYGAPDQPYQIAFPDTHCVINQTTGSTQVSSSVSQGRTVMTYNLTAGDHSIVQVTGGTRTVMIHILDTMVANFAWETLVVGTGDYGSHYLIGSNETVLIFGPYFMRWAWSDGNTLNLQGDVNGTDTVVFACDPKYTAFTWNDVTVTPNRTSDTTWSVSIPGPASTPVAPNISSWVWKDSLPEIEYGYDDSDWTVCNLTSTTNKNQPYFNGKYILYGQEYGFSVGATLYRGTFSGGSWAGLELSVSAGYFGAAAIWVNGKYTTSAFVPGDGNNENVNVTVNFDSVSLSDGTNYITVVIANTGLEEDGGEDTQSPRGIRGYELMASGSQSSDGSEMAWKMQGNQGGNVNFPDKVRTIYNVGGFFGERQGWYLPGFNGSDWSMGGPSGEGNGSLTAPGVRFYKASVNVDYPEGLDIHYSFKFPNITGDYRAQLFVNGWQFGRRFGDISPTQLIFPVPPGVLVQGTNELAMSLFAFNDTQSAFSIGGQLELVVDPSVTTSVLSLSNITINSPTYDEVYGGSA